MDQRDAKRSINFGLNFPEISALCKFLYSVTNADGALS